MNSRTKIGLLILLVLILIVTFSRLFRGSSDTPLLSPKLHSGGTFNFEFESLALSKIVQQNLQGKDGIYAVYIQGLGGKYKDLYTFNEQEIFPTASLYKLIVMAATLDAVEQGKISNSDTVTSTKSHLSQVLGEEDFGYEDSPEEISFTIDEAMDRVGTVSDNFAAIILTEKLREIYDNDPLSSMAGKLEMRNTKFADIPQTDAEDIALFFKKLYRGEVVSQQVSKKLAGILSRNRINNRLPALLPSEIKIAHKTGELPKIRHDGGIVYFQDRPYVIVLLSKDLTHEDDGVDVLAQISKDVFDHFSSKN